MFFERMGNFLNSFRDSLSHPRKELLLDLSTIMKDTERINTRFFDPFKEFFQKNF